MDYWFTFRKVYIGFKITQPGCILTLVNALASVFGWASLMSLSSSKRHVLVSQANLLVPQVGLTAHIAKHWAIDLQGKKALELSSAHSCDLI